MLPRSCHNNFQLGWRMFLKTLSSYDIGIFDEPDQFSHDGNSCTKSTSDQATQSAEVRRIHVQISGRFGYKPLWLCDTSYHTLKQGCMQAISGLIHHTSGHYLNNNSAVVPHTSSLLGSNHIVLYPLESRHTQPR